jgi:hypothetical protein
MNDRTSIVIFLAGGVTGAAITAHRVQGDEVAAT